MNYFANIEKFGSKVALITDKENFTYNSIIDSSNKIFKKVKERSLILLKCYNCFELLIAYVAFSRFNCPMILIDNNLNDQSYLEIIDEYKPDYIFQPKKNKKDKINYNFFDNLGNYELLENDKKNNTIIHESLSLLIPTSGSMGSPKFVRHSYQNVKTNIDQVTDSLKVKDLDRSITTMPLNYIYGLSIVNSHLFNGSSIVLNDYSLIDKKFWKLLNDKNVSNFGGVPFMYEVLSKIGFENKIPKSLKYITQAGGKLSNDILNEFIQISKKNDLKFITMYGQTEATSRMSYLNPDFLETKAGSIGKPVKDGKFYLINNDGKKIENNNEIGELVYEGKNVSMGYAKSHLDLKKGDENQGKLFTGDLAKRDDENFYYIVGRLKRISKIFGIRINLDDIEVLLKKRGFNCVCIGNDKKLNFFIENEFENEKALNEISKNIGIHKSAIRLNKINKIPRNKTGKVLYSELN